MLLALRSLYENLGDVNVTLDGIDLAIAVQDLTATGDSNVTIADGIDIFMELSTLDAQLPVTSGGGGFWHVGPLGIPTPYVIPQPIPQDVNVSLQGITLHIEVGDLQAEDQIDITDDELLLILAAVADDERADDSEAEYAELLTAAAAFCVLAQATVNWEVDCD